MGYVLVRKSVGFQVPIGDSGMFYDPFGGRGKEASIPLTNPVGLERTPRAAAAAVQAGAQAAGDLARLPRTASLPADEREQNRIDRATMQNAIDNAALRSVEEQVAVKNFQRLNRGGYNKYNPDLVDRAAERAGKVGVIGSKLGGALGTGLSILTGATALSDASAAGQDLSSALIGAGTTGASTYATARPFLQRVGAKAGGRLGSMSVMAPHNIGQGARNVSQAMDNIGRGLEAERQPVAVTPTVAQPTVNQVTGDPNKITSYAPPQTSVPVTAPVNQPQQQQKQPVAVQQTLPMGPTDAAEALTKPAEGSVEAMKETGAAGKQEGLAFMEQGAPQSMAGQSMAGNQPKPEEEEEEQ
tara:strand:- start:434 stop:1504 length:1071 start_codon:yes stop_codon:yes gene_type:complete